MMLAPWEPCLATWLPIIASFSMFPLLERDGLALPYLACCLLYLAFAWPGLARLTASIPDNATTSAASHGQKVTAGVAPGAAAAVAAAAAGARLRAATAKIGSSSSSSNSLQKGPSVLVAAAVAAAGAVQSLCVRWSVGISISGLAVAMVLHVARAMVPPPPGLLWLHDRLFVTAAFLALVPCVLWLQVQQWRIEADSDALDVVNSCDGEDGSAGSGGPLSGSTGKGLKGQAGLPVEVGVQETQTDVGNRRGQRHKKAE